MPVSVNGVMREPSEISSLVNGVWRSSNKVFANINGVFRNTFNCNDEWHQQQSMLVKGFIIKYKLNKFKKHSRFPSLRYNRKIPFTLKLSENDRVIFNDKLQTESDLNEKSMIFEYDNTAYEQEGILMYEGHIYLVTNTNEEIDIALSPIDYRLFNNKLTISCETVDENYGYNTFGWNSIFSNSQFIHSKGKPDVINQYHNRNNNFIISPEYKRIQNFNSTLDIGIARDMTSPINNMIGSRGFMTHTFYDIKFNNEPKPFKIEIVE